MTSPWAEYLIESALLLLAASGVALLVMRFGGRARRARSAGPLELLARLPLDARRSLALVRVLDQVLIIGSSEAGVTRLGQLPLGSWLERERAGAGEDAGRWLEASRRRNEASNGAPNPAAREAEGEREHSEGEGAH